MIKRPNSRVNLDKGIERIFGKYEKSIEIRSIMANTIVGHMLPDAVVKGGSSLKLRYGNSRTRVTMVGGSPIFWREKRRTLIK